MNVVRNILGDKVGKSYADISRMDNRCDICNKFMPRGSKVYPSEYDYAYKLCSTKCRNKFDDSIEDKTPSFRDA